MYERRTNMHSLNTILVKIEKTEQYDKMSKEEKEKIDKEDIVCARETAESETESYIDNVYDWRETSTAGRWKDEYPVNVILGRTEPERLIKELERCLSYRTNKIKQYLSDLKSENNSSDIETISENIIKNEDMDNGKWLSDYCFLRLATLLYGEYTHDSLFFDTTECDSKISKAKIEKIKNEIDQYALVFFDYHF